MCHGCCTSTAGGVEWSTPPPRNACDHRSTFAVAGALQVPRAGARSAAACSRVCGSSHEKSTWLGMHVLPQHSMPPGQSMVALQKKKVLGGRLGMAPGGWVGWEAPAGPVAFLLLLAGGGGAVPRLSSAEPSPGRLLPVLCAVAPAGGAVAGLAADMHGSCAVKQPAPALGPSPWASLHAGAGHDPAGSWHENAVWTHVCSPHGPRPYLPAGTVPWLQPGI